jgi:NTE family protein
MGQIDETHRADGVFQGGGVKGLGLVGALLQFAEGAKDADGEQLQITEWVNVAGTSAGSICASLIACGSSAKELESTFMNLDFAQFEDWGRGGKIIGGLLNLAEHHGLAHGEAFHKWIDDKLEGKTFKYVKNDDPSADPQYRLQMIATDITNKRMLVLPDDIVKYKGPTGEALDPDELKIADAVRMSMSIPYFFQPIILTDAETGVRSTIVDGGVLSNFPVWLFDTQRQEAPRPTFGFHLVGGRGVGGGLNRAIQDAGWAVQEGVDIFHTATDAWDDRFRSHSTVVRTCTIDAGSIGTTDFNMTPDQKTFLLNSGREAARNFISAFKRDAYMNTYGRPLAAGALGGT